MSEEIQKELEELKTYLIGEYKANGGTKDLSSLTAAQITNEIDHLKRENSLKEEIKALKDSRTDGKPQPKGTTRTRDNQALAQKAASIVSAYMNYVDPPLDERSIEDQRYLNDSQVVKMSMDQNDPGVVILRDKEGRLA